MRKFRLLFVTVFAILGFATKSTAERVRAEMPEPFVSKSGNKSMDSGNQTNNTTPRKAFSDSSTNSWSDYTLQLSSDVDWSTGTNEYYYYNDASGIVKLTATVEVDNDATLVYKTSLGYNTLNVSIDGQKVRTIAPDQEGYNRRYFEELTTGTHTIEWEFTNTHSSSYSYCYLKDIGVAKTPLISVNLLEPGSLGTEVLKQVDNVANVRRLKITGEMNDDDWARIDMMPNLFSIDLSEAKLTSIPNSQFEYCAWFHKVLLPEGLTLIRGYAFRGTSIDDIKLPSTLTSIGSYAFQSTLIKEIDIPDAVTELGESAFSGCYFLSKVHIPNNINTIPSYAFNDNYVLSSINLHNNLTSIEDYAFSDCFSLNARIPERITNIGDHAFNHTPIDSLKLPETLSSLGTGAFEYCNNLVYTELPTSYARISNKYIINRCDKLETLVIKSPTLLGGYKSDFISNLNNITVKVPDFLVSTYKLDSYWYEAKAIEGFSTADVKDWTIKYPLTLNSGERFEGAPNIYMTTGSTLTVNGETGMELTDFLFDFSNGYDFTQLLNKGGDITVNGNMCMNYLTYINRWYFVSLPFDIRPADIECPGQFAIRYYDGAGRAANGANGNWKDYAAEDVIPAGTGFIFQTNIATWTKFNAVDNANKSRVFSNKDLSTALAANPSETSADKGWNLVGNPWMTYYNIHTLGFTAPITTYYVDGYGREKYYAYSIIDDDIAIYPTQAFFVQCPEDITAITFPASGRQLTSVIENQNGIKADGAYTGRNLIDIELEHDGTKDRTRVVVNEQAETDYNIYHDAAKFFSTDNVPQIYTTDADGTEYAINERPALDGVVPLCFIAPSQGIYSISLSRCQTERALLRDLQTGTVTDLMQDGYTFTSDAGTFGQRFELVLTSGVTSISGTAPSPTVIPVSGGLRADGEISVFALDGRMVTRGSGLITLRPGTYIVKSGTRNLKVNVR